MESYRSLSAPGILFWLVVAALVAALCFAGIRSFRTASAGRRTRFELRTALLVMIALAAIIAVEVHEDFYRRLIAVPIFTILALVAGVVARMRAAHAPARLRRRVATRAKSGRTAP